MSPYEGKIITLAVYVLYYFAKWFLNCMFSISILWQFPFVQVMDKIS